MSDVLVIGAGPAGMSAALELRAQGLSVTVVDDQPTPGGRVFAAIETRAAHNADDREGAALATRFRKSGGDYLSGTEVWQIETTDLSLGVDEGPRVFLSRNGRAEMATPRFVVLASGAQERAMAFPGWQLPGVMTVGGAQLLLKTAHQIPSEPVWLAGTGPLLLLYVRQLIAAGGEIAGILDTTPRGRSAAAARHLPGALAYGWRDLARGVAWLARSRNIRVVRNVNAIEAIGDRRMTALRYRTSGDLAEEIATSALLVHDGVVPAVHTSLAAGCAHRWNVSQRCFEPVLDGFGAASRVGLYVVGDGAGILGARAAVLSGRLAALGIAVAAGVANPADVEAEARRLRSGLAAAARFRSFLDALYPPTDLAIPDNTMVCRCEEVTAGQVRNAMCGRLGVEPDAVKIATRIGMGPCQGRQCGLSLTRLIAETSGRTPAEVGLLRARPPLKPLTIGELASLETAVEQVGASS